MKQVINYLLLSLILLLCNIFVACDMKVETYPFDQEGILILVKHHDGKYGLIQAEDGAEVLPKKYDKIRCLLMPEHSEVYFTAYDGSTDSETLYRYQGQYNELNTCYTEHRFIMDFTDDQYVPWVVEKTNGKKAFVEIVEEDGKFIYKESEAFDDISKADVGYFLVKEGNLYGIWNSHGYFEYPTEFAEILILNGNDSFYTRRVCCRKPGEKSFTVYERYYQFASLNQYSSKQVESIEMVGHLSIADMNAIKAISRKSYHGTLLEFDHTQLPNHINHELNPVLY